LSTLAILLALGASTAEEAEVKTDEKTAAPVNELIETLPHTVKCMKLQLKSDFLRWGNTWKFRPVEGQEDRFVSKVLDYYDEYTHAGSPMPWLKILCEAHIAFTRKEQHDQY